MNVVIGCTITAITIIGLYTIGGIAARQECRTKLGKLTACVELSHREVLKQTGVRLRPGRYCIRMDSKEAGQ